MFDQQIKEDILAIDPFELVIEESKLGTDMHNAKNLRLNLFSHNEVADNQIRHPMLTRKSNEGHEFSEEFSRITHSSNLPANQVSSNMINFDTQNDNSTY